MTRLRLLACASLTLALPLSAGCRSDDGKSDDVADSDTDADSGGTQDTDSTTSDDGTSDDTTSSSSTTDCTPGELNCECNDGLCLGDLECVEGICVEGCIPGELGCECNNGQCLGDLVCEGDICVDPDCIPGEEFCECNNGECLGDLECVDGVCMEAGGTDTDTTTDDGGECPNANEMLCDGECVDVLANNDNCGGCGVVCEFDDQAGGCEDGACGPYWYGCGQEPQFTNCDDQCADEGKTCVANGCGGLTFTAFQSLSSCEEKQTQGGGAEQYIGPCDGEFTPNPPLYGGCCCV